MLLTHLYAAYRSQNRKLRAEKTHRAYLVALRQLCHHLGRPATVDDLSDETLLAFERWLTGRSDYTVNERLSRLKAIWRWAARSGIVQKWPTLQPLDLPEPSKPTWSIDDVRRIAAAASRMRRCKYDNVPRSVWWRAWVLALWYTGERPGALRACQWSWLRDDVLSIPASARKGHKAAIYLLPRELSESIGELRPYGNRHIWHFPKSDGTYYAHFGQLLRLAGLPDGRKDKSQRFRRTHLTYWEMAGHDATTRAMHSSRAVTERFYLDRSRLPLPDPSTILPHVTTKDIEP